MNQEEIESVEVVYLTNQLILLEEKYRQAKESSKRRLTIPALFRRSGDENFISDYLAYILDPDKNGIGIEPLQVLLSLTYENIVDIEFDQVLIRREYTFRTNPGLGRIDFVIELGEGGGSGIIGIENKMFSPEGENQTASYVEGLQHDFEGRDIYFIFLTPYGRIPIAKEFKPLSYGELVKALREIHYSVLNDIHKTVIWEDFLYHLEEYIAMTNSEFKLSAKTTLYLEHHDMLLGLDKAYQEDSQKIYDYITDNIKDFLGENWHFNFLGRNIYQEINNDAWSMGKYYIFYQYFFSKNNLLIKDKFSLMLGVYPKNAESRRFVDWIKTNKTEIESICNKFEMEIYPTDIKDTPSFLLAYKEFPLGVEEKNLKDIHIQFIQAMEQFLAFKPLIDISIAEYKKLIT